MSGHSHWAGIKHKKAKEDKRRGKLFSKLAKAIMSAARRGGKDVNTNLPLQYAIEEAKAANVSKDTIERAVLKGAGELAGEQVETIRYEGYGAGGAAVIVDAVTDNRNRTTSNVRRIFEAHNGKLGTTNCVSWMFNTKGLLILKLDEDREEEVFDIAVEAGAEDFQKSGDFYELTCPPAEFQNVLSALNEHDIPHESAEITEVPTCYVNLGTDDGRKSLNMLEEFEEDEDVENVYSNFNLSEDLVRELSED